MFDVDNYNISHITDFNDLLHLPHFLIWSFPLFSTVMIVLGLAGNGFVLLTTIRYNAIDLDKASLLYLQHLAVADTLLLVFSRTPALVVLISREWIMGETCCFITQVMSELACFVDDFMILSVACHRALVLLKPFRPPSISMTYLIIALGWVLAVLQGITLLCFGSKVYYSPYTFSCQSSPSDLLRIPLLVRWAVPLAGIILANLVILGIVFSMKPIPAVSRRKPALLVFGICFIYLMAWVPTVFHYWCDTGVWSSQSFSAEITMIQISARYIHLVFNPFIYTFTNRRFRNFVMNRL